MTCKRYVTLLIFNEHRNTVTQISFIQRFIVLILKYKSIFFNDGEKGYKHNEYKVLRRKHYFILLQFEYVCITVFAPLQKAK